MRSELNEFIQQLEITKNRSQRTGEIYSQILADFDVFLAGAELTEENARAYLRSRATEVAASTQSLTVSALRSLAKWLKLEGKIKNSWLLKSPKLTQKKIRVFAEEDLSLLLNVMEQRPLEERVLFHLLYGSALRISEALSLTWENIELSKMRASVLGKGARWRKVPLTEQVVNALSELKTKASGRATGTWHADLVNYQTARKWVGGWGVESGVDKKYGALHPHLLRHALASHLLRRGAKLPHIQKLLGHRHLSTTEKYTHLEVDDLLRAYDKAFPQKRS